MPVVADVAEEYREDVAFVAVAGRSDPASAETRAAELFGDTLAWGIGDHVWDLYGVRGQPVTVLLTGDDVIVDGWYGGLAPEELTARVDNLIAVSG